MTQQVHSCPVEIKVSDCASTSLFTPYSLHLSVLQFTSHGVNFRIGFLLPLSLAPTHFHSSTPHMQKLEIQQWVPLSTFTAEALSLYFTRSLVACWLLATGDSSSQRIVLPTTRPSVAGRRSSVVCRRCLGSFPYIAALSPESAHPLSTPPMFLTLSSLASR